MNYWAASELVAEGAQVRGLSWTVVVLSVAISSATLAQEVPCSDVPVALNLPGFERQCQKIDPSPAERAKGIEEMDKAGMPAAFIEVTFPPNAATYILLYSEPKKPEGRPNRQWGMIVLSIAHPQSSLKAIPLRQIISMFKQDWMMGSKIHLDWLKAGKHKGYDTLRYIEVVSNDLMPLDPLRSCFGFVQHRNGSTDGQYGRRLWGYHCRNDDQTFDDDMIVDILSAISVR